MKRALTLVLIAGATVLASAAIPASAFAESGPYCDELVPAHTDCATSPGNAHDWWNGFFTFNITEYPGAGTVSICEHVYRRSNGATVSDKCANNFKSSEEDLNSLKGIELSGHSGNNSGTTHTINGSVA